MTKILTRDISFFKSIEEVSNYFVYQLESQDDELKIRYYLDDWSSVWIEDKKTYDLFPSKFKVVSGGWYGKEGRWKTLKRIKREIIFSGVSELENEFHIDEDHLRIRKKRFSNTLEVEILSNEIKSVRFKCTAADFGEFYRLSAFSEETGEFVNAKEIFKGGFRFDGEL